uniref:CN hydrolase domain-containing protein n=1 Tax=Panagrellus redivivus TaxID=6233 RepID=A0A7E4VME4_PANRE
MGVDANKLREWHCLSGVERRQYSQVKRSVTQCAWVVFNKKALRTLLSLPLDKGFLPALRLATDASPKKLWRASDVHRRTTKNRMIAKLFPNDLFSRKIKIAVAQAGSYIFDTPRTLEKLEDMTVQAAQSGAQLILFPETFIGGYPKGIDFGVQMGLPKLDGREEFKRYFDHAISYAGKESDFIAEVACKCKIMIAVGVVEKEGTTLFSSVCIQIYLAPTVDDREVWLSTMRTIAMEGRCFVISACQYLTLDAFPEGHAAHNSNQKVFIAGGSCAINPFGDVILSPTCDREFVKVIECDLAEIIGAKFDLDIVTSHSRPDIFTLYVNEKVQSAVKSEK